MEIEYLEKSHQYLIDGICVPSVTQLLQVLFKGSYENVPKRILENKAAFGTSVHGYVEMIEKHNVIPNLNELPIYEKVCVEQYLKLKERYNINGIESEKLVHYKDKYCGRLDLIADVNYSRCLLDVKTTAKLNKEYLSWQLSLYELALNEMGYNPLDKLYCIWLPKGNIGKLIEVPRIPKKKLEEFIKENTNE